MGDALDELIVDSDATADVDLLARILNGYIRLNKKGEVLFEELYGKETNSKKIALYILARKAAVLKKLGDNPKEGCTTKEISEKTFMESKNVSHYLGAELKGIVTKSGEGLYIIPNYNLKKCESLLKSKKE